MAPVDTTALAPLPQTESPDHAGSGLRTLEIEEASNRYIVHKISLALVPVFARLGVTPNMVSGLGALCGLLAAWSYFHFENPWACVLGFVFMIGWHMCDGADGQLARRTGQTSDIGFVIDGICDYLTFIFVYVALGLALTDVYGAQVWGLIIAAGVCHAVQAAAFEMQRDAYVAWTGLKPVTRQEASGPKPWPARVYAAVQAPFRPVPPVLEHRLSEDADTSAAAYRQAFRRTVLLWSVLSANNRTIALFVFCLSGFPLGYFVYECVVLTVVLSGLIAVNRGARIRLSAALDRA